VGPFGPSVLRRFFRNTPQGPPPPQPTCPGVNLFPKEKGLGHGPIRPGPPVRSVRDPGPSGTPVRLRPRSFRDPGPSRTPVRRSVRHSGPSGTPVLLHAALRRDRAINPLFQPKCLQRYHHSAASSAPTLHQMLAACETVLLHAALREVKEALTEYVLP